MLLPEKLETNTLKIIPFQYFMAGEATLITEEKRLFERFFDKISAKVKEHL